MCLFVSLLLFGPRLVLVIWYFVDPARWALAFDTAIWPLLGFVFAPWTTMMYVLVSPAGITGLDWLWLGLALVADLGSLGGGAWQGRNRYPTAVSPP